MNEKYKSIKAYADTIGAHVRLFAVDFEEDGKSMYMESYTLLSEPASDDVVIAFLINDYTAKGLKVTCITEILNGYNYDDLEGMPLEEACKHFRLMAVIQSGLDLAMR
ncbi:MAG: hypothetical protein RSA71_12180, partial [Eubacterium sp.]